uniref:G-protein coupled receptors family 1 profile domain-containing protein n=1 Tax=Kryptolebias marmoratus TaxID=37003 RepID=A0A3Q3ASM4_KRYMA
CSHPCLLPLGGAPDHFSARHILLSKGVSSDIPLPPPVADMLWRCPVSLPGNIAVIILRPNWEHMSRLSQSLLLNLAVSDLLSLLILPLVIDALLYGWRFNLVSCKLLTYVVYCSIYSSQLTVTGLSIQRYLLMVHQQRCQQVQKRLVLVLLWLVAFILSTPHLVVQQLVPKQQWTDCRPQYSSDAQWMAVLMTETIAGMVSFFIVVFSYIHIRRKVSQAAFFNNPQTTRLITSIIVSFVVLWVPFLTTNVLGIAAICISNKRLRKFFKNFWNIVSALTYVNKCLNPLLYAFTSRKVCNVCSIKLKCCPENGLFSNSG